MAKLVIYKNGTESTKRCEVNKWECVDKMMGENRITFTLESPVPIDFEVGDWCSWRGETYKLNVEPSCTQKSRPNTHGAAFVYESVRMDSAADDLTRCMILDIIPTSGNHIAGPVSGDYSGSYGTNYTGSANFTLNCFETTYTYNGETHIFAPVHALLDRIKANLDRLYPNAGWQIYLDDDKCHSDDAIITFSNWTAAQALAEVHNTFKLDYVVRGNKILVGDVSELVGAYPALEGLFGYVALTDPDAQDDPLFFGYGWGYLDEYNQGKTLFQIKKVSKPDQAVVTRLRAMGSTKNMPYRYYHKTYGTQEVVGGLGLPQTMFVQNLQLPDTFLPPTGNNGNNKAAHNANRDSVYGSTDGLPNVRHVLGETNDAYIDKNDDATTCPEGIREGTARWDGTDGDLPEIYPTIEEATYGELRANDVPDMYGTTGSTAFPNYDANERLDEILGVGDDCNIGDGVMTDSEAFGQTLITVPVNLQVETGALGTSSTLGLTLFTIDTPQEASDYILSYTTQHARLKASLLAERHEGGNYSISASFSLRINIYQVPTDGSASSLIAYYQGNATNTYASGTYAPQTDGAYFFVLPDFHELTAQADGWNTNKLTVTKQSAIRADLVIDYSGTVTGGSWPLSDFKMQFQIERATSSDDAVPNALWQPSSAALYYSETPFSLILKDIGVDFSKIAGMDGEAMTISMKSGQCAGREFTVKTNAITKYPETAVSGQRRGWKFELDRVNDDSIHAYFPSANNKILPGDQFVLLNIELPDAYIKAAETRLLVAATEHLADNCDTKYTYQPSVDDIYLQRNIDRHTSDPENSVFWRLKSGMKFPFYGIPDNTTDPLPVADITIEQVTIRMGEKPTPQVDIVLNEDIEQSTMQRLQVTVDRIYGSVFSTGGGGSFISPAVIRSISDKYYLSKTKSDTAEELITFLKGIDVQTLATISKAVIGDSIGSEQFLTGFTGNGWNINASGTAEFNNVVVRGTMRVFELLAQQVKSTGGEILVSAANGKIASVTTWGSRYVCTIESSDNNYGNMFLTGDFVRCQKWNKNGGTLKSYWVEVKGSMGSTISLDVEDFSQDIPEAGDELVLMGSSSANRQSAISITATSGGVPKITILDGITAAVAASGNLTNCTRAVLGSLSGITDSSFTGDNAITGYGLYSDNAYLKGKLLVSDGTSTTEIGAGYFNVINGLSGAGITLDGDNSTITLKADKTIVSDDFFVRNLETIPADTTKTIDNEEVHNQARVRVEGSLMTVFGFFGQKNIEFGVDENGYAVMNYYDNGGNLLYNLGPEGLNYVDVNSASLNGESFKYNSNASSYRNDSSTFTTVTLYSFRAKRFNGVILGDDTYTHNDQSLARNADGKWFTSSSVISTQNQQNEWVLTNLASGVYKLATATVKTMNTDIDNNCQSESEFKLFFCNMFDYTPAEVDVLGFSFAGTVFSGKYTLTHDIEFIKLARFTSGNMVEYYDIWQPTH